MVSQFEFTIGPYKRGFHIITDTVLHAIGTLPSTGILHLFMKHTSAGLTINENADPDVLHDFELYFNTIVPEHLRGMMHTTEGPDDMPAHIKAAFVGSSVSIPITNHALNLGIWQGIYLCEFRNHARARTLVATITA